MILFFTKYISTDSVHQTPWVFITNVHDSNISLVMKQLNSPTMQRTVWNVSAYNKGNTTALHCQALPQQCHPKSVLSTYTSIEEQWVDFDWKSDFITEILKITTHVMTEFSLMAENCHPYTEEHYTPKRPHAILSSWSIILIHVCNTDINVGCILFFI